ncbi:uncharacterized protein LOC131161475 [Malania oleifera]|uniref:uncharacterized protein LOC131161475 n=1 Tax=Malania oleifera TaxID=397392 RepID=UPI0025ADC987|nr:uncharacterized protein LOC131161475 [Malania oleifera]
MNWIQRKIYLYNVTFGLYMLDWWERYLFNTLVIVLMWFMLYNGSRVATEFCKRIYKNHFESFVELKVFKLASLMKLEVARYLHPE